jgi:choline dehydrogenase-like flavoprotein
MILDLNEAGGTSRTHQCDVAIIGAGVAGTIMACELARRGLSVVVVESGAREQTADTHPLNRVRHTAQVYQGAEHGRFRCLGGTSTRWGGAMIPFLPEDLDGCADTPGTDWPLRLDELTPYVPRLEKMFDLPSGDYDLPTPPGRPYRAGEAGFRVRAPKWPSFAHRNVAHIFAESIRSPSGPQIWLNATVTDIRLAENGRVCAIEARSPSGAQLRIAAQDTVVAAGAIESTRLLLGLDASCGQQLFEPCGLIGRYFYDHLSAPVARIEVSDRQALNKLAGFRFEGSGMRSIRFELEGRVRRPQRLPGAFAHIAFGSTRKNGFDGLREIYRAVQKRHRPRMSDVLLLAGDAGWLARAGWTRFVDRRVLPPDHADYELHLVTEQIPVSTNRITLSGAERDPYGTPLAEIHWQVSERDLACSEAIADELARYWAASPLGQVGMLTFHDRQTRAASHTDGGGIYHPGGTVRMASTSTTGVVNPHLAAFAVPNLRVVSTAVFPTGGSANPTMMLLLLALRAADEIASRQRPGRAATPLPPN